MIKPADRLCWLHICGNRTPLRLQQIVLWNEHMFHWLTEIRLLRCELSQSRFIYPIWQIILITKFQRSNELKFGMFLPHQVHCERVFFFFMCQFIVLNRFASYTMSHSASPKKFLGHFIMCQCWHIHNTIALVARCWENLMCVSSTSAHTLAYTFAHMLMLARSLTAKNFRSYGDYKSKIKSI